MQLTSGPEWAGHNRRPVANLTATGTLEALRKSNSVVALRVNSVVSQGYRLKSAMLHGGYDFLWTAGRWAIEPGLDLGVGQALRPVFDGVGAYGGASTTLRFRPYPWTIEPSYNLAYPMLELVLLPRIGFWMPPQDSNNSTLYGEGGVTIGIRGTFGTDLVTSGQGQVWDGGPQCRQRSPSGHGGPCNEENP
jgi:hypothetical protein